MAQLSRPYQIALAALVLAVVMWFIAFGRHSRSTSGPSASAPAQSTASRSAGSSSGPGSGSGAGSSHIYHGSAPGVEGLSKAIAKAHGAVKTSESYGKSIEEKSAHAAGEPAPPASTGSSPAATTPAAHAPATHAHKPAAHAHAPVSAHAHAHAPAAKAHARTHAQARHHAATAPAAKAHTNHATPALGVPTRQQAVEAALAHGKIALLLFWNPHGTDDVAVRGQVRALPKRLRIAVYEASPKEVTSFGSITRQVPVYGTPTMIIIGKHGRTTTLTGLQDTFTIEQAIAEARSTSP